MRTFLRVAAPGKQLLVLSYEQCTSCNYPPSALPSHVIDPDWPTLLGLAQVIARDAADEDGIDVRVWSSPSAIADRRWQILLMAGIRIRI